jgi:hypothetical protein
MLIFIETIVLKKKIGPVTLKNEVFMAVRSLENVCVKIQHYMGIFESCAELKWVVLGTF